MRQRGLRNRELRETLEILRELDGRLRTADDVALDRVAAERSELSPREAVLDALAHGGQAEAAVDGLAGGVGPVLIAAEGSWKRHLRGLH